MKYYQELTLLLQEDIDLYFIWHKLYQQLHLALVENKTGDNASAIGVAFPEYNADEYYLGTKLRLLSENDNLLEQLHCEKWLNRLRDYVYVSQIKPVPEKLTGYACFKHKKLKGNKEKLARRRAKRKGESFEQALAHYANYEDEQSKLPFINMISQTNGENFRIYIEKQNYEVPCEGTFSCYGLSNKSTVPLF